MRKFRRKPIDVEALQHDGTFTRAVELVGWVKNHGGTAEIMPPEEDYEGPPVYYVKLVNSRALTIVPPGFWIDRVPTGHFYVVSDDDFHYLYDPIEEANTVEEADFYDREKERPIDKDEQLPLHNTNCENCGHGIEMHRRLKSNGNIFCLMACSCDLFLYSKN